MPVTIQIRDVPDRVYRRLKARAAKRNMSLSSYLLEEIVQLASERDRMEDKLTPEELLARLATRTPVTPSIPPEDIIRHHRDGFGGSPD